MRVRYLPHPANKDVVQLTEFVTFLNQILKMDLPQAFQLAQTFQYSHPALNP